MRQGDWPCAQPSSFSWAWDQLGMNISPLGRVSIYISFDIYGTIEVKHASLVLLC